MEDVGGEGEVIKYLGVGSTMWKKSDRSTIMVCALIFGVLAMLFILWIIGVNRWRESVTPGGNNLKECLSKLPNPSDMRSFNQYGQEYLALFGDMQGFPKFPSGPPIYIFDVNGHLVDWTPDNGDDGSFWGRWPEFHGSRVISHEEMMRWPGAAVK